MLWRMAGAAGLLMALVVILVGGWTFWCALMPLAFPMAPERLVSPGFVPFVACWLIAGALVAAVFPRSE